MVFEKILNCHICNTANRTVSNYCKNCGEKLNQKNFDFNEAEKIISKEIFKSKELSQDQIDFLKKRLNEWVDSIPYHNHKDLFDKAVIKSAKLIPYYSVKISVLNEKREVLEKIRPYSGFDYPKNKIDMGKYLLWNEKNLSVPKEFKETSFQYDIPGTFEVFDCEDCGGAGKVRCSDCSGKGMVECGVCSGRGSVICIKCDGKGRIKCKNYSCRNGRETCSGCDGKGFIKNYSSGDITEVCSVCGGSGTVVCKTCLGSGYLTCDKCNGRGSSVCHYCLGRGTVNCKKCEGVGKVVCGKCKGEGKLIKNLYVEVSIYKNEFFVDTRNLYPENLFVKSPYLYGDSFEELNPSGFISLITDDLGSFKINIPHPDLSLKYGEIEDNKNNSFKKEFSATSGERSVLEKTEFFKIDVYKIEYLYEDKNYEVFLFSEDGEKISIYSASDPVKEFNDSLSFQISEDVEKNDIAGAEKKLVILQETTKDSVLISLSASSLFLKMISENYPLEMLFSKAEELLKKTEVFGVILLLVFNKIYDTRIKPLSDTDLKKWSLEFFDLVQRIKDICRKKGETELFYAFLIIGEFYEKVYAFLEKSLKAEDYESFECALKISAELSGYFPEISIRNGSIVKIEDKKENSEEEEKKQNPKDFLEKIYNSQRGLISKYLWISNILFFVLYLYRVSKESYYIGYLISNISLNFLFSSFLFLFLPMNGFKFRRFKIAVYFTFFFVYLWTNLWIYYMRIDYLIVLFVLSLIFYFSFSWKNKNGLNKKIEELKKISDESVLALYSSQELTRRLAFITSVKSDESVKKTAKELYKLAESKGLYGILLIKAGKIVETLGKAFLDYIIENNGKVYLPFDSKKTVKIEYLKEYDEVGIIAYECNNADYEKINANKISEIASSLSDISKKIIGKSESEGK